MPNPKVIRVRGARTHNLKNVSVEIPLNAVTVVTGVSGSGKSSLAFDTLYAEAQRRYVESLSIRARQAMDLLPRADVEAIENLPAAVAIEQKTLVRNPRSTVGTITELSDALRLLFARTGQPFCPEHGEPLSAQTVAEMVEISSGSMEFIDTLKRRISIVNSTPARGALNIPAMAPAAPQPSRIVMLR